MTWKLHHAGRWSPSRIHARWSPSTLIDSTLLDSILDQTWSYAQTMPIRLFDGPLCRLERVDATATLQLELSQTSYRRFFGTNLKNPHLRPVLGDAAFANPVGVSTLLITADHRMLLGRRSQTVAYHPGRIHPFAGALDLTDAPGQDVAPDIATAARRELREEANLTDDEILDLTCTGLIEDLSLTQPEFTFIAHTPLTAARVAARVDPAEHDELVSLPMDMKLDDPLLTPVARGTIALARQ